MKRSATTRFLACLLALAAFGTPLLAAPTESEAGEATVTYVTGRSVYIDAGKNLGLVPGVTVEVVRDGVVVARLTVTEVSTDKASCSIDDGSDAPVVGDRVRFSVSAAAPAVAAESVTGAAPDSRPARRGSPFHGRIGVQYLALRDGTGDYGDYSQPALDLRLDAPALGGSAWGLHVDARARRVTRNLASGGTDDDSRTRVYRLSVERAARDDPWSFAFGRQYAPSLANVALFDGVSAAYNRERFSVGAFSGSAPAADDFGYDGDLRQHGVYWDLRAAPGGGARWSLTTGVVGSYESGTVDREFAYVQGRWSGEHLLGFLVQEVDFNRDWKSDEAGESSVEPTSTLLSLRYRIGDAVTLFGGLDNRRRVRLLRDRVTPATQFDDAFRRGVWGGADFDFGRRVTLSLDGRVRSGDPSGDSDAFTARFGLRRLTRRNLSLHARATRFTNDMLEGWLYSGDAGLDLGQRVWLQVEAGLRDETSSISPAQDDSITWVAVDLDVTLARRWYLLLALERSSGDLEEYDQLFTRLSYRF